MNLAVILGAWFLYLAVGVIIALIPGWPARGSFRFTAAFAVPAILGLAVSVERGDPSYMVAGFIAAAMVYALVQKRAEA